MTGLALAKAMVKRRLADQSTQEWRIQPARVAIARSQVRKEISIISTNMRFLRKNGVYIISRGSKYEEDML